MEDLHHEVIKQAVATVPIMGWLGALLAGIHLEQWLLLTSIGYIILQASYLVWKWRKESKKKDV